MRHILGTESGHTLVQTDAGPTATIIAEHPDGTISATIVRHASGDFADRYEISLLVGIRPGVEHRNGLHRVARTDRTLQSVGFTPDLEVAITRVLRHLG